MSVDALFGTAIPYHLLHNALDAYLDLPCFLIQAKHWKDWHGLVNTRSDRKNAVDFEDGAQWEERIRHNEAALEKACRTRQPQCVQHRGLWAVLVPVVKQGRCLAVLHAGPFLRSVPGETQVVKQWRSLTGRYPSPQDKDFADYVRVLVGTPVLDDACVTALQELFLLFAAVLCRSPQAGQAAARMAELQEKVFARRLSHRHWVEWQVIHRRFFRFNDAPQELMGWEERELGLKRFPTTIVALKREGTGQDWTDWLAASSFQREALQRARSLEESIAYPLGEYGVLLVTSVAPGLADARQALTAKVEKFRQSLVSAVKAQVWAGVGSSRSGEGLQGSYHEAIAALHVAVAQGRPLVQFEDVERSNLGETGLRKKIKDLATAVADTGGRSNLQRDTFIQTVVLETKGRPEATRRALMETLHRVLETLEGRQAMEADDLARFESELVYQLESAVGLNEMLGRFASGLDLLSSFLDRSIEGGKFMRLNKAREAIRSSLERPWTLPLAAKQYGFSATSFSREFTRFAGLPFSEFLLAERLLKAKRLLAEGPLPLGLVSENCGFKTTNYFFQVFKKKVGLAPGAYRERHGSLVQKRTNLGLGTKG